MITNRAAISTDTDTKLALDCIEAGISAADPTTAVEEHVSIDGTSIVIQNDRYDLDAYDRLFVVGGGNAAATAASALETVLGDRIDGGVIVTDTPIETERVDVRPGDHPIPSERGVDSTRELLELVDGATEDDLVLCIVAGGASALMPAPADGVDLPSLQSVTKSLLGCGATIDEINVVRKHCSRLKGGQLAATAKTATIVGLVFSDVVGNRLDVIASGPLTPDESTYSDALNVLDRYEVDVPDAIEQRLRRGDDGEYPETPGEGDPVFETVRQYVLADTTTALEGATEVVSESGYEPLILSSRIRGEAREAAKTMAGIAEEIGATGRPIRPPTVLLSGGETTVTLREDGTGGPNQEFVLSMAIELECQSNVTVASVDTDGIDGASDAAGAIATAETATPEQDARARSRPTMQEGFWGHVTVSF